MNNSWMSLSIRNKNLKIFFITLSFFFVFLCRQIVSATDFSVHGYYRDRVVAVDDLDLQKSSTNPAPAANNDRFGFIQYNQMRLRLEPNFKLNDNLSIHAQFDVLDNILFGTRDTRQLRIIAPVVGEQTLPPGAGSFYMTGPSVVGENGAINIRRIWADIMTPVGKFRIGRQPSHWGLGIFQNDGNELQGDFGDTADRVMYLLQYEIPEKISITGGLLWDVAYEAQFDPRITGLATAPNPNRQDTQRYAAVLMFERPEFSAGLFGGIQRRNGSDGATTMQVTDAMGNAVQAGIDGNTLVYFTDLYGRYEWENYKFQIEGVFIGGTVTTGLALSAIPFSGLGPANPSNPCSTGGIICLPRNQKMQALMAALEAEGHYSFGGEWKFQSGFAEGDGSPLSQKITQFGFRPDYQIALMMFHYPLGTTPSLWGQSAQCAAPPCPTVNLAGGQPVTGNFINNTLYISAGYKHKFDLESAGWANWAKVGAKITTAWAHRKNTNVSFTELTGTANLPSLSDNASSMWKRWYGLEFDLSGEAQLWDHLYAALEGGVLIPGRAYDVDVAVFDPNSIVQPIPKDKANLAWMIRLSTILQF